MNSVISNLNFAQPLWLWALLLIPLGWGWYYYWHTKRQTNLNGLNQFIDAKLLPHLLIKDASKRSRRGYGWLYALVAMFLIIALANPRWSFKEYEAYQNTASMVILLDLAASMNATDISPSRIIRARQNIEDLLNLSKGLKIGLVGFAGTAHLISPITDDIQTIKTYIPALDTDLTNFQGNSLHQAFKMAGELLANEPGDQKSILLVSDGNFASDNFSKELNVLTSQGISVHAIGVGTSAGAPYKTNSGALHKSNGNIVISKLNSTVLQKIAKEGQGVYTESRHTDMGIRAILSKAQQREQEDQIVAGKVRHWEDRYYVFLIPAAMLLLYLIRQRVLSVLITLTIVFCLPSGEAYALESKSVFRNSEQQGQQAYVKGDFKSAAEIFTDSYHKGVALYRNGQFSEAEKEFKQVQRGAVKNDALYNSGNAQMQQRKWRAAIKSYEAVLAEDPDNFPAQHNLEIAKKMLEENDDKDDEEEDKPECECDNPKESDSGKNDKDQDQQKDQEQQQEQEQDQKQQEQNDQKQDQQQDQKQDPKQDQKQNEKEQQAKNDQQQANAQNADVMDDARAEQWLNRIDSDIKVFLKNKFYVEDVLSAK